MTKKQIESATKKWQKFLNLENYELKIKFIKRLRGKDILAQSMWDPRYLTGTIEYHLLRIKDIDENTIIHELIHAFTSEILDYAEANGLKGKWLDYFNERLVCFITNLIIRTTKTKC